MISFPTPQGMHLHHRFVNRGNRKSIILSLRLDALPRRVLFELSPSVYPPVKLKKEAASLSEDELLEKTYAILVPKLWEKFYSSSSKNGIENRKQYPPLLSALWYAERDAISALYDWSADTKKKNFSAMDALLKKVDVIWFDATPKYISIVLDTFSKTRHQACIQLLKALFNQQILKGETNINPWKDQNTKGRRTKQSHNRNVRVFIESVMLTDGQMGELVSLALSNMASALGGQYLGLLMLATVPLPVEEICALTYEDIIYDKIFNIYSFSISAVYTPTKKAKPSKRCKLCPHTDPIKKRKIPLSSLLEHALELRKKYYSSRKITDFKNLPIVCDSRNFARHCAPKSLTSWINSEVKQKMLRAQVPNGKKLTSLIAATPLHNLPHFGCEDEEVRYLCGKTPKLVSAKHYCDFGSALELNKLHCLQDRWLTRYYQPDNIRLSNKCSYLTWYPSSPGQNFTVDYTYTFPKINSSERPMIFTLEAPYGAEYTLSLEDDIA